MIPIASRILNKTSGITNRYFIFFLVKMTIQQINNNTKLSTKIGIQNEKVHN